MEYAAILEMKKEEKKVSGMRLEHTCTLPAGSVDVAHRFVISRDGISEILATFHEQGFSNLFS